MASMGKSNLILAPSARRQIAGNLVQAPHVQRGVISPLTFEQFSAEIENYFQSISQGPKAHFGSHAPILMNHISRRVWGKGKAENIVNDQFGFDINRRMAGHVSMAISFYAWSQHGFPIIPFFTQQRIRNGIVKPLILDGNPKINQKKQREKGITSSDIFLDLQRHITSGSTPKQAADLVFRGFNLTPEEAGFSRAYSRSEKITHTPEFSNHVFRNLVGIAEEAALLTHAWQVSNLLATRGSQGKKEALDYIGEVPQGKIRSKLHDILEEEEKDLKAIQTAEEKVASLRERAKDLRKAGNNKKAKKLERKAFDLENNTYYGELTEFASRYRDKKKYPIFSKPTPMSFKEIMTLLVTKAPLPKHYVDCGILEEEGIMLLKVADAAEKHILSRSQISFSHYSDLGPEEGEQITDFRDQILVELNDILEREISTGANLKNLANWELHPVPILLQDWTTLRIILDTDNIVYPEFLNGLTFAEPEYGDMIRNPIEILHRAENYKLIYKNWIVKLQKWRDSKIHFALGRGRNNRGVVPQQILGRDEIRKGEATFLGYGDISNFQMLYFTTHSDALVNPQNTNWNGRSALEKIIGPNFWDYKPNGKKDIKENPLSKDDPYYLRRKIAYKLNRIANKIGGYEDIWDSTMQIDRFLKLTAILAGGFLGLSHLAGETFGTLAALNPAFTYALAGSLGALGVGKAASYALGKDYHIYQYVSTPRNYEFDASEDLLFTLFCLTNGFSVNWDQGHFQQNDCMTGWERDMFQKLRWQAQNARLARQFIATVWKYRKAVGVGQAFDAMGPCIYNNFGMAATFNRLGIWSFIAFGLPPMLVLHDQVWALPGQNLLNWIVELAISNYSLTELGIRFSNMREGTPWKGTTLNFGYERGYIPFNFIQVQRRLWSNSSAGFNVTGALDFPAMTHIWGSDPSSTPLFMRQSLLASGINLAMLGRIFQTTMLDGAGKQDMMALTGGLIGIWPALDLYYTMKGITTLNDGTQPTDAENPSWIEYSDTIKKIEPKPVLFDAYGRPVLEGEY